ncbi:MAG: hypothetical protein QM809_18275 [Gordonia sp. (in: high G+C Gram-positive bacteria)]|uniref:hypothetical protein n=1 Tax=Gordonia sp. (in: high G+C Gram-positive bacteria) TaxID=84139 RepID=UPI0039E25BD3
MAGHDLLTEALDLLPEAWADEIAADAAGQGYDVVYVEAPDGLRTDVVRRLRDTLDVVTGDRLDEAFPEYHGIGSGELLDALGIVATYERST